MKNSGGRACRLAFTVFIATALTATATATATATWQEPGSARATPFLPPHHWAVEAVRRLAAAGAVSTSIDIGARALRASEVARAFDVAAASETAVAAIAEMYRDRFAEEFAAWTAARPARWTLRAAAAGGYENDDGRVVTGIGYSNIDDWTGTSPIRDPDGFTGSAAIAATAGKHIAASVTPAHHGSAVTLDEAQVILEAGAVGAWAGRRRIGFGVGAGGSIVLSGAVALDGGGLYLARPLRLPWILRHLGPIRFETFLSRIDNGDVITEPWLWGARGSLSPHARLAIGINRAAMFGGNGNAPASLRNILLTLVGEHGGAQGEFANQLLSADVRWRPPLGALPLELYAEWGLDDSSGGYWRSPAILGGIHVAAVPGAPMLSIGVERTSFAAASFKNTMWYRNVWLRGGWTHDRRVLGHPLGGHGTEWLFHGSAAVLDSRLRIDGGIALRDRAKENLFAPERMGGSTATSLDVAFRAAPWLDLVGELRYEDGATGWSETRAFTAARVWLSAAPTAAAAPRSRPTGCPDCSR